MNKGQEMFSSFLISHTKPENVDIVKKMLEKSFKDQEDGNFDSNSLNAFNAKLFPLLKEESVDEVKKITENFKNSI